jgi:imidazolonepropionase-like amidohydrolase
MRLITPTLKSVFTLVLVSVFPTALFAQYEITQTIGTALPPQLLITDVNILRMDGEAPIILSNYSLLIEEKKIVKIAPSSKLENVDGANIVKGQGRFLLPGLIDVHVHIWDEPELAAYLSFGVTTVRNVSGMPFHLTFMKEIEAGNLEGPRLITTGPILNGQGRNTQVNHQIVNNAKEARDAVRQQYQQGYRHLKVYSNLTRQAYDTILYESQKLGMTIMGHTPEGNRTQEIPHNKPFNIAFNELLDDSFVSIEHMESIVWHALSDELNENKVRRLAKEISNSNTAVTPTLIAHNNLILVAQSQGKYLQRPGVDLLNPFITALEKDSYEYWSSQSPSFRNKFDKFYLVATKIFQEEGVILLAGTDSGIFTNVSGFSLLEELKLLVQAGLTPFEALQTATINPAQALKLDRQLGKIEPGYIADLILVKGDPTEDILNLKSLSGLVLGGTWYDENEISKLKRRATTTSYERTELRVRAGLSAQGTSLD